MMKTVIVTVPGMIEKTDWKDLEKYSQVDYVEKDEITQDELCLLAEEYNYLMLNYDVVKKLNASFYEHPNIKALKGISFDITGMNWANIPAKSEVLLMNIPHYSTESVAESIVCEVLLHAKKIHQAYGDMIKGEVPQARKGINLKDKTVGIVGLGHIGSRTAELLQGFGMNVIAYNRSPKDSGDVSLVSLGDLFERSDVICVCLRTVDETREILGANLLNKSKQGQIIVNLASRELVDHNALMSSLKEGKIAGYSVTRNNDLISLGLDKFESVSMPPANAWFSDESLAELKRVWVENIIKAIEGCPQNKIEE